MTLVDHSLCRANLPGRVTDSLGRRTSLRLLADEPGHVWGTASPDRITGHAGGLGARSASGRSRAGQQRGAEGTAKEVRGIDPSLPRAACARRRRLVTFVLARRTYVTDVLASLSGSKVRSGKGRSAPPVGQPEEVRR
jgi:hypothetical protein